MNRLVLCILTLAVLPACRTAGPELAPGAGSSLTTYVDQLRVLRHDGSKAKLRLSGRERAAEGCLVAVRVRSAAFQKDAARFSLETLGEPRLRDQRSVCRRMQPQVELTIPGMASAGAAHLVAGVDAVLQTPEAYLKAKGVNFARPAAEAPKEWASREVAASSAEQALGRQLAAWPQPLLSIDPWYHDPSGRVKHLGLVEMDAVVGADGHLYRPRFKTSLSDLHQGAMTRVLPLWRFEPARRGNAPVAARVSLTPVLRIY